MNYHEDADGDGAAKEQPDAADGGDGHLVASGSQCGCIRSDASSGSGSIGTAHLAEVTHIPSAAGRWIAGRKRRRFFVTFSHRRKRRKRRMRRSGEDEAGQRDA